MLVSRCLRSFHTATTKVGSEANVYSLSSTDSNPRFKTSPKPILDTATLNVIGSCGKFVVSTNENGLGLWKRETGTSTEWSQRLEVYSRQVMEIFQKSATTESKLNKKQPCLTHKIFFVCLMVPDSYLVCCTLYIEEQWITIAFGGTTAFFRLEYRLQELIEHIFWSCCFLATWRVLLTLHWQQLRKCPFHFWLDNAIRNVFEYKRTSAKICRKRHLFPWLRCKEREKKNCVNLHRLLLQCYWQETDGQMPHVDSGKSRARTSTISGTSSAAGGWTCSSEKIQWRAERQSGR